MLDNKKKEESNKIIKQLISENKIIKPKQGTKEFFMNKADNSLQISKRIFEISENPKDVLTGYMWVINSAYYSMFFAATTLLAYFNHKINVEVGIHKLTYHALIYYFLIDDNKLQKHFIEQYKEAFEEAEELLQISEEKAVEMLENFSFEISKRKKFTYDEGLIAERNKAKTSLERAEKFLFEVKRIIEK